MDDIRSIVGSNLKKIRKEKHLTLEGLSRMTEVSISMLGEIERGMTNPTITVLWKIADGLKIPFSDLIRQEKPPVTVVRLKDSLPFVKEIGFQVNGLIQYDHQKKLEMYWAEIQPGMSYDSEGHLEGIEEYIMVCNGVMELQIANDKYTLNKGDVVNFKGDAYHQYKNISSEILHAYMVLYYGDR